MLKFRAIDGSGRVSAADCRPGEVRAELAGHWLWGRHSGGPPRVTWRSSGWSVVAALQWHERDAVLKLVAPGVR